MDRLIFTLSILVLSFIGAIMLSNRVQIKPLFSKKDAEKSDQVISGLKFITLASVLGFIGVFIIDVLTWPYFMGGRFDDGGFVEISILFLLYFVFGLPVAISLGYLFGYPLWRVARSIKIIDRALATQIGLVFGAGAGGINALMFVTEASPKALILDWISTVVVGGFAGYWSFTILKKRKDLLESGKDQRLH